MSDTRDIRLLALWRDDPTEAPMTLDLRIDARGGVVSTWDVFGAFDLDGAHCHPFVLRRDGTIDFGATSPELWHTNLREIVILVNALFTVHWNDADSGDYKIVKVAALGAKDSRK
jgi:hypothetical protein